MKAAIHGVYLVTDTNIQDSYSHLEIAELAIAGGVDVIQFRDKKMAANEAYKIANTIAQLCKKANIPFIVNDRVDLALAVDADGVHLGQNDLPLKEARQLMGSNKIVGGTASTLEEAKQVQQNGADYLGFGHIYETKTKKKDYAPRGVQMLREVCRNLDIPVIAIGGINAENAGEVMQQGAAGFAVTSAICAADNPQEATQILRKFL